HTRSCSIHSPPPPPPLPSFPTRRFPISVAQDRARTDAHPDRVAVGEPQRNSERVGDRDDQSLTLATIQLGEQAETVQVVEVVPLDRKSTRLNSSHLGISYAVFCLKKKNQ